MPDTRTPITHCAFAETFLLQHLSSGSSHGYPDGGTWISTWIFMWIIDVDVDICAYMDAAIQLHIHVDILCSK